MSNEPACGCGHGREEHYAVVTLDGQVVAHRCDGKRGRCECAPDEASNPDERMPR